MPDAGDVVAWDRYAYANNSPIRNADPSGHCIWDGCVLEIAAALVVAGTILSLSADTPQVKPGEAANFTDLLADGIQHEEHATIVNEGLQSLKEDPSVMSAQGRLVEQISSDPKYGNEAYTSNNVSTQFTANGPSRNWKTAAITNNQAFWMVHTGTLSATNITISEDGAISTTWQIHDNFDFIPGPDHDNEYNYWAEKVQFIYNDLFEAAKSFPTDAYWDEIIPPLKKEVDSPID